MTSTMDGRPPRAIVMAVVMTATFMAALDSSIVNIALPRIGAALGADVRSMQWVVASYLLAVSSLLLVFGRLADVRGHASLMAAGFGVFGGASIACGLAGSLPVLVAGRAAQGVGASMLMAAGPALVTTSFPASERGRALGMQATATYLGLSLGPSIGGWLTSHAGWHAVFFVNVPIAVAAIAGILLRLAPHRPARPADRPAHAFDLASAPLLAAALVAVLLGLSASVRVGWGARPLATCAAGVAIGAVFLARQARTPDPLLPLVLFRSGVFSGGVAAAWLQYLVLFVVGFLVPFYLQDVRGLDPSAAGLVMTAQPAVMVLVTAPAGWLSDRIGVRVPATAGMIVIALAVLRLASLRDGGSAADVALALAGVGLGVGLFTTPNNSAIMGAAPRDRQGVAAALVAAARNVGMMSGVATAANLLAFWRGRLTAAGAPPRDALLGAMHSTLFVAATLAALGGALCLFRPAARREGA